MTYLKVEFFVPLENLPPIIDALNDGGYLQDGPYDSVYAYNPVVGHFRPLEGASPYSGQVGQVSQVQEVKVESRIRTQDREVVEALIRKHHPYEVAVVNFMALI